MRSAADPGVLDKAIEVPDKPVSMSDVQIFGKKCIDMGVREVALRLDEPGAAEHGDEVRRHLRFPSCGDVAPARLAQAASRAA